MALNSIYSDANPIIELAKKALNQHDPLRELDLLYLELILKAAQNDEVSLYTSSLSIAECVSTEKGATIVPQAVQEFFIGVLTSGRMFKLVQDTIFVAERARDLRWNDGIVLSGADAIHVASAIEAGCTEFMTWDTDISRPKTAAKLAALRKFGITTITPSGTTLLPSYYRHTLINAQLDFPPVQ